MTPSVSFCSGESILLTCVVFLASFIGSTGRAYLLEPPEHVMLLQVQLSALRLL